MRSNKGLYIAILSLMALSWAITIVFMILAPDIVPHRVNPNVAGGYTNYGSKTRWLINPISVMLIGGLMLLWARISKKRGNATEERAILWAAIPAEIMFILISVLYMSTAFVQ